MSENVWGTKKYNCWPKAHSYKIMSKKVILKLWSYRCYYIELFMNSKSKGILFKKFTILWKLNLYFVCFIGNFGLLVKLDLKNDFILDDSFIKNLQLPTFLGFINLEYFKIFLFISTPNFCTENECNYLKVVNFYSLKLWLMFQDWLWITQRVSNPFWGVFCWNS